MIKLKELRKSENIKQDVLAKGLGISQTTISNWESGAREPDIQMLIKISKYFNVTVDYLINNDVINNKFAIRFPQNYNNRKICKKLWLIRENKKMTRKEVANTLHVSTSLISEIENDRSRLNLDVFLKLCKIYEISPIELLNENPKEHFILMNEEDIEETNKILNKLLHKINSKNIY